LAAARCRSAGGADTRQAASVTQRMHACTSKQGKPTRTHELEKALATSSEHCVCPSLLKSMYQHRDAQDEPVGFGALAMMSHDCTGVTPCSLPSMFSKIHRLHRIQHHRIVNPGRCLCKRSITAGCRHVHLTCHCSATQQPRYTYESHDQASRNAFSTVCDTTPQ